MGAKGGTARLAADIGGTFTDIVLDRRRRGASSRKVLTTPRAPEEAVIEGTRGGAGRGGPGVRRHRRVRARHDARHQRHHRAQGRADRADRHRRLPRRPRDRRREPLRPVRHLHRASRAPLVPRELRFTVPERIDVHGAVRLALDEAAVRARREAHRAARRRGRRHRADARLRQPGARAAHRARSSPRHLPGRHRHAVVARSAPRCASTSAPPRPSPTPTCSR